MTRRPRTIGIYGVAGLDILHRPYTGVLRFAEEMRGIVVRDFRMPDRGPCTGTPVWTDRVDGIVVSIGRDPGSTDARMADWVLSGRVPAVSTVSDWLDPRVPCFIASSRSLATVAARHLTECGAKSCLFVGFAGSRASSIRASELAEQLARCDFSPKLVQYSAESLLLGILDDEDLVRGETRLIELLKRMRKPLGVWALNDNYARAVSLLCDDLGLRVPADVRVLGCDDLPLARTSRPPISSIRTPGEQIGYMAMRALDKMLDGGRTPRRPVEIAGGELVPRQSTVEGIATQGNLEEILDYIARHACAGLTVEDLAENFLAPRRKLEKQFRARLGRSPGQEIQLVRLQHAKKLLGQSRLSVSRIASMVGFAEPASFSKFFQKHVAMSPREFRDSRS